MSLNVSRFTKHYLNLSRSDVAHDFPRHVFLREPNTPQTFANADFNKRNRVNPVNAQEATLIHLTERFSNSELYLIGTMNTSTFLAQRTRNLIQDIKPDVVFIQANERWAQAARKLGYVKTQEEMNLARKELESTYSYRFQDNTRKYAFLFRWFFTRMVFKIMMAIPSGWNPLLPGLESKFAMEEAEKCGAKLVLLGHELDNLTWERLYHENRNTISRYFRNIYRLNRSYYTEMFEHQAQLKNHGPLKYVEGVCDQYQINWFIQTCGQVFPELKRIIIDMKEEDIFKSIMANRGKVFIILKKKMVAVVNQIHMEGIEHHWCHSFGQVPRNSQWDNIDPIGDMDLRNLLFERMYHGLMRDIKSSFHRSPPSSFSNSITPYYRESNAQYEHRCM